MLGNILWNNGPIPIIPFFNSMKTWDSLQIEREVKIHDNEVPPTILGWKSAYKGNNCSDRWNWNTDRIEENRMPSPQLPDFDTCPVIMQVCHSGCGSPPGSSSRKCLLPRHECGVHRQPPASSSFRLHPSCLKSLLKFTSFLGNFKSTADFWGVSSIFY